MPFLPPTGNNGPSTPQFTPDPSFGYNVDIGDSAVIMVSSAQISLDADTLNNVAPGAGTRLMDVYQKFKALEYALSQKRYPQQ